MFKDYKLNYNNSTDKKIKNNYLKEIHKRIIEFKDVNQLDGFKIINSISKNITIEIVNNSPITVIS